MMNERAWAELLSVCTVQTAACAYLLEADGALTLKTTLRMHIQRAPFSSSGESHLYTKSAI